MINKTAIVAESAKIGVNVEIGAYSIIGKDVEIGDNTWIGPHVIIEGKTKIGSNNKIFQFASLGAIPQDLKFHGENTTLEIGDNNIIREFTTLHLGTKAGGGITKIGNHNLLMNYVHIAHDCIIGDHNIFSNNATLAGHVLVGNHSNLGGFAKIAQFCFIGDYSFIGGDTTIMKDVPPYIFVAGVYESVKVYGLNLVGLKRKGFSETTIKILEEAYDLIYRKNLVVQQAISELEKLVPKCQEVQLFIDALKHSKKGIVR